MKKLFVLFFIFYPLCLLPSITIYVHGSQNATKLLPKDIWYCGQGLHHISKLPKASLFVQDALLLQKGNSNLFDFEHYYTFGWSGKVNFDVRKKAGYDLFEAVQSLLMKYADQYGHYPTVRIITNSHGGNIALHMVEHLPFFKGEKIALELIMLACPVQKVTETLINHSGITRSYVLYSTFDLIQKLDFYTYEGKRYFPARTFASTASNCSQILVKVNGKRLTHTDFCHSIMRHIPEIIDAADKAIQKELYLTELDIQDPGFIGYNGFNILSAMRGERKCV